MAKRASTIINNYEGIKKAEDYIKNVSKGKLPTNKLVKLAVKRHLQDLQDVKTGKNTDFYFSKPHAFKALAFFSLLKHAKGEWSGKPFELSSPQAFIVYCLFGWLKTSNSKRRFNYAYLEVARKWGKTTFAAGLVLYMFKFDGEASAECYTTATKRDQAKICFEEAQKILKKSKLKNYGQVFKFNIHDEETFSKVEPLSSEADTLDGLNPSFAVVDEFHAHKTDELINVIKSGMGSREQPLVLIITTAGFNKQSPCYKQRRVGKQILEGKIIQDNLFAMIFTLDQEDDWEDEKNWVKANPGLGVTPKLDYIRNEYISAKNNPSEIVNFKTKNLNIWCDASEDWITRQWDECKLDELPDLTGRRCYAGLDLASVRDITALTLFFPPSEEDERGYVIPYFFVPEMSVMDRVKKDSVNYDLWIKQGHVIETPGNTTDYDAIRRLLTGVYMDGNTLVTDEDSLMNKYDIITCGFDKWNSSDLIPRLVDDGIDCYPVTQNISVQNNPTKKLESLVANNVIAHGGNPCMDWMCSNIELFRDTNDNIKLDKGRASEKIDGFAALVNALHEWMAERDEGIKNIEDLLII